MTNHERADQLRDAVELIDEVLGELNVSKSTCGECGLRSFVHYGEHILWSRLRGVPKKLNELADDLDRGTFDSKVKLPKKGATK